MLFYTGLKHYPNYAGGHWDGLHCISNFCLHSYPLLYDRVWVDSSQVLFVLLLHTYMLYLLHIVRHDACCADTKPPYCCHLYVILPQFLEFVLRFPHFQEGMLFLIYVRLKHLPLCPLSLCIKNSLLPTHCSNSQYGGGGTTGLLLWPGHYMGL